MTKNIAIVQAANFDELIAQLHQLGYGLTCPDTGYTHGFTAEGDGPVRLATQDVVAFLVEGSGVLFWRSPSESLFAGVVGGKPAIYFDGFTAAEENALCNSLLQLWRYIFSDLRRLAECPLLADSGHSRIRGEASAVR